MEVQLEVVGELWSLSFQFTLEAPDLPVLLAAIKSPNGRCERQAFADVLPLINELDGYSNIVEAAGEMLEDVKGHHCSRIPSPIEPLITRIKALEASCRVRTGMPLSHNQRGRNS